MKKLLVLLLALVVVGGVFAQATVNGYVRTIGTISDGNFSYADRLRLNLSWSDDNVGFKARLQGTTSAAADTTATLADDTLFPADADALPDVLTISGAKNDIAVKYAYGWVNLFDGKAKITGGFLDNYDYDISSGVSEYQLGNVANDGWALAGVRSMLFQFYPVAGLDLGLAVTPAAKEIGLDTFGFNVKYTIENIGAVVVESTMGEDFAASRYSASFQYTGVEGLTASVGYKHAADETMNIYGLVNYVAGDLTVELAPEFNIDESMTYVEGYVSYAMGDATFNVLAAYDTDNMNLDGTYFFGLEAIYKISKATLQANFYYDEVAEWSIPLVVKVAF